MEPYLYPTWGSKPGEIGLPVGVELGLLPWFQRPRSVTIVIPSLGLWLLEIVTLDLNDSNHELLPGFPTTITKKEKTYHHYRALVPTANTINKN